MILPGDARVEKQPLVPLHLCSFPIMPSVVAGTVCQFSDICWMNEPISDRASAWLRPWSSSESRLLRLQYPSSPLVFPSRLPNSVLRHLLPYVCPPHSYTEALAIGMRVFRDNPGETVVTRQCHESVASCWVQWPYKERRGKEIIQSPPKIHARRWLSANQEESPY